MILEKIKADVNNKLAIPLHFIYNGTRNQIEEFDGEIVGLYNYVFLIKVKETNVIKSFSYSDILIGSLKINNV